MAKSCIITPSGIVMGTGSIKIPSFEKIWYVQYGSSMKSQYKPNISPTSPIICALEVEWSHVNLPYKFGGPFQIQDS